jgi:uncharacterized protein YbjQ (UPF0145 family)
MANSKLDKYIEMLSSKRAETRFDACEELRVGRETSVEAVRALEKTTRDPEKWVADAALHALEADIHYEIVKQLGLLPEKFLVREQEEKALRLKTEKLAGIILVTTPSIDGRKVLEYLGIVSSEVVLGTGFLTELSASFTDFFGLRDDKFQEKLKDAKDAALTELRRKAFDLNADAVLGVDLDYSVLANNMLMVMANGTAVRLEENGGCQ